MLAGGDGEDMLIGQSGDDTLDGGAGVLDFAAHPTASGPVTADLAAGRVTGEGTDRLIGVEGVAGSRHADTLQGGSAASILSGGPGNDTIVGTGTTDILLPLARGARVDLLGRTATGEGTDAVTGIEVVVGTPGDDVLAGSDADEVFIAGGGADSVSGGGGSDILLGGDGADALAGGSGDDVLRGDQTTGAADRLDGGDGADVADYGTSTAGVSVSLASGTGPSGDSIAAVEMLSGSGHADVLVGDAGNNTLMGGPGDDAVRGGSGNDVVSGGAGVDALSGEAGADYLSGDQDGGSADGGPDSDVCVDLSPATGCEATEFAGGQAPGARAVAGARPAPQTEGVAARPVPQTEGAAARRAATNARAPHERLVRAGQPVRDLQRRSAEHVLGHHGLPPQAGASGLRLGQPADGVGPARDLQPRLPQRAGRVRAVVLHRAQQRPVDQQLLVPLPRAGEGPPGHLDDDVRPQPAGQLRGGLRHVVAGQRHRPVAVELAPGGLAPAGQRPLLRPLRRAGGGLLQLRARPRRQPICSVLLERRRSAPTYARVLLELPARASSTRATTFRLRARATSPH